MNKIWFDMDGTIADLYGVENWLDMLENEIETPYLIAKPLVNLSLLARYLNILQKKGFEIGIISWLSKNSTSEYDNLVLNAKITWLKIHMPSVKWDEIKIVPYGMNKWELCGGGFLFDDEMRNRETWRNGAAFEPKYIFEILKNLNKAV